jgi:hypothetical protein
LYEKKYWIDIDDDYFSMDRLWVQFSQKDPRFLKKREKKNSYLHTIVLLSELEKVTKETINTNCLGTLENIDSAIEVVFYVPDMVPLDYDQCKSKISNLSDLVNSGKTSLVFNTKAISNYIMNATIKRVELD